MDDFSKDAPVIRSMHRAWLDAESADDPVERCGAAIARCRDGAETLIEAGKAMTIGLFCLEGNLFWYAEVLDTGLSNVLGSAIDPETINAPLAPFLSLRPGTPDAPHWAPLADVFHFNEPASPEHWRRKTAVGERRGRMARLREEMTASYIYYHYQLQEERAFPGPKYEIIGIHEDILFGYQEFPAVEEAPVVPGRLSTQGTPVPWSDAHMERHFRPWPDGHLYFKPMETLYAVGLDGPPRP